MAKATAAAAVVAGIDSNTISATFVFNKETPGAVRYFEVGKDGQPITKDYDDNGALIGQLYVRKKAIGGRVPQRITVSVTLPK